MKNDKKVTDRASKNARRRVEHEVEGGASGALVGAVVGASAGPPGAIAGAILGGLAGALAGAVLDQEGTAQEQRARELDAEIGVSGGTMGAPNLAHPPPTSRAYSAAPASVRPAEGPVQTRRR